MGEFVRGDGKRENFIQIVSVVRNNKMIQKLERQAIEKDGRCTLPEHKPALQIAKQ